jgi:hypothetical protein
LKGPIGLGCFCRLNYKPLFENHGFPVLEIWL